MGGAKYGREDVLGRHTMHAAVAAADLAHHDGRANRVLGAPVGHVDGGLAEEGEERRRVARQMGGESLDGREGGSRGGAQVEHLLEQPAAARSRSASAWWGRCPSMWVMARSQPALRRACSLC